MRILWRIILFGVVATAWALPQEVRVWQGALSLPTYEEGLPDPNPPFDQLTTSRFNYPYTLRNNLTGRRANHEWRAMAVAQSLGSEVPGLAFTHDGLEPV